MAILLLRALFLATSICLAQAPPPIIQAQFGGQNDTDPTISLQNGEGQSALNVEATLSGTGIAKRAGYVRTASLKIATSAATGTYSFVDSNGNYEDIVCSDHFCQESINKGNFTVLISTAGGSCMPRRWTFTQINGKLFGANDCRDSIFGWDGTTLTSPISTSAPLGSIVEATKDRLVVGDVAANPNGIYYSQSGNYTNFTTGINSADPYIDVSGAQGDRVQGLKWALGRLFIFKTNSISSCILGDQYTSKCFPVSGTIGTSDPLSIVEIPNAVIANGFPISNGSVMFRGTDKNYWSLDGTGLHVISRKISNLIASQNSGSIQSNTQTSLADWQAGTQSPAGSFNTTTLNGSIFQSSATFTDSVSSTGFSAATFSIPLSTASGNMSLVAQAFDIVNGNFAGGTLANWTCTPGSQGSCGATVGNGQASQSCGGNFGSNWAISVLSGVASPQTNVIYNATWDGAHGDPTVITGKTIILPAYSTQTLSIQFKAGTSIASTFLTSSTFTFVSSITYIANANSNCPGGSTNFNITDVHTDRYFNEVSNSSATYLLTSGIFNTTFASPIGGPFIVSSSTVNGTSINLAIHSEPSLSGPFDSWTAITNGNRILEANQYWQYESTFTTNIPTAAPTALYFNLPAATTGQFTTQCIQPGTGITAWGLLNCGQTLAGQGSFVFYSTSAATCAGLPTGTPSTWQTSVTNNATLPISTNAAVEIGFQSLLGSATDQAQIDACTLFWTNGVASPPSWATYDPIKNAVYWTTAINNSVTSNRVLKYDLNFNQWFPMGINAQVIYRNPYGIFFGDSTGGYWNQYGVGASDNGAAINSYWISKDWGNQNTPFVDNDFSRISLVAKNQVTGTMNVEYTVSNGNQGNYTVSLSTNSAAVYVHANYNLVRLSPYQFMNIELGNNSSTPWEVDGLQIDYTSFPWRPENP